MARKSQKPPVGKKGIRSRPEVSVSPVAPGRVPLLREQPEAVPFWRHPWAPLLVILAVGALARILQFLSLRASDPSFSDLLAGVDSKTFDDMAQSILNGDWLLRGKPVFYMGPFYPYFLTLIYGIFGHSFGAAHAAQYL